MGFIVYQFSVDVFIYHDAGPTKECLAFLKCMTADVVNEAADHSGLLSFRHMYVTEGDILYLPPGSIFVEKAVGARGKNVFTLRVASTFLDADRSSLCAGMVAAAYPSILALA